MKKILGIVVFGIVIALAFAACGNKTDGTQAPTGTSAPAVTTAAQATSAPSTTAAPSEHQHTIEIVPAEEPTCQYAGLTEGQYCTECEEWVAEPQEIPALAHTPGIYKASSDGVHFSQCEICAERIESFEHEQGCEICGFEGYLVAGDDGQEAVASFNDDGTLVIENQALYLKKIEEEVATGTYKLTIIIPEDFNAEKMRDTCLFIARSDVGLKHYNTTADENQNGGPYYFLPINKKADVAISGIIHEGKKNQWNETLEGKIAGTQGDIAAVCSGEFTIICKYSIDEETEIGTLEIITKNSEGVSATRTSTTKPGALSGLYWGFRNRLGVSVTVTEMSFAAE